jgi:hypothetical protein
MGGLGAAKTAGNYAAILFEAEEAQKEAYAQVRRSCTTRSLAFNTGPCQIRMLDARAQRPSVVAIVEAAWLACL